VRRHEADEIPITVGFLSGVPRQGRIGVGDSTVYARRPCAGAEPALTVGDLDRAITAVSEATGAGSAARGSTSSAMLCRATDEEAVREAAVEVGSSLGDPGCWGVTSSVRKTSSDPQPVIVFADDELAEDQISERRRRTQP
jgi:hypothetical protein